MQNQQTRSVTQSINQTQSLAAIQTLLRAGLGTIAYLRNLLPEDNFTRSHFTSVEDGTSSQPESSQESASSRTHVSGFRITTITRGYTDEADRILNYMEYGIFDALEKRYLRSFIFGIYLDVNNPTNIVEAYTFNFKYHQIPESGIFVPVMSLAEGQNIEDPITKALKKGKVPTLKDVKLSVKALLKTLIQAISNMDVLPRRRFASFKIFYTDETPEEYEPPHFECGDAERDKWYFMTHDLDEVPERTTIGRIHTGHHSVNLNVTSIASYLPSSSERGDNAAFSGLTGNPEHSVLTPQQEASFCRIQAEKQSEDAKNRNLMWLAEDSIELSDAEAEGEDDPEYMRLADGTYERVPQPIPVGIRNEDGCMDELPAHAEMHFGGVVEKIPQHLHEVAANTHITHAAFEETQSLRDDFNTPVKGGSRSLKSRQSSSSLSSLTTTPSVAAFDPEMLANMRIDEPETSDTEMLDLETQAPLFGDLDTDTDNTTHRLRPRGSVANDTINCDCEITVDDECCFCEGVCGKWYHIWCIGYHSVNDPRIPAKFICFDCRIHEDQNWELIRTELYPQIVLRLKDLALDRRAIKVAQRLQSFVSQDFSKLFGDIGETNRMLKRLQDKDFLLLETIALDDMGLKVATRSKKGKGKENKSKTRKNIHKTRYAFNPKIAAKQEYLDYFEPDDMEKVIRMMGIATATKKLASRSTPIAETQSQTQEETQDCPTPTRNNLLGGKRASSVNTEPLADRPDRPQKRLKMSVALGVDLAE